MKVVIIEDEAVAAQHLRSMLAEACPDVSIVATLESIEEAVSFFNRKPLVDLVLLDIELGDGQSFDIFQQTQVEAPVIFTTAYQDHALKAFKLNSIDYLLKPVDQSELQAALDKYKRLHTVQKQKIRDNIVSLLQKAESLEDKRTRYLARSGTRLISVLVDEVAYFYTRERIQYIKTVMDEDYIIDKRLDEIESETDPGVFFRVNRQFILNYNAIKSVHTWFSGKLKVGVQPKAYEEIIISRLKSAEFKRWLGGE